ncbi:MAG: hypothetical protein HFJ95_00125 [Muribaculaceae bacterium]|nr:hypothetical protein [Muribaculaceae bacterium]
MATDYFNLFMNAFLKIKHLIVYIGMLVWMVGMPGCGSPNKETSTPNENEQKLSQSVDTFDTAPVDTLEAPLSESVISEEACESEPPTQQELSRLGDTIAKKFEALAADNPLRQNVWGWGVAQNHVDIYVHVNTPYWQKKFRNDICDSKYLHFDGPKGPKKINIEARTNIEVDSISLSPDASSFPADSEKVSFTLRNNNSRQLQFGVSYVVACRGEDGNWYDMPTEGFWNDMGIGLNKGGSHSFDVTMRPLLNNNKPGIYRLYKEVRFDGDKDYFWIMTEFRLE